MTHLCPETVKNKKLWEGRERMEISSRADVSAEDHRCDLCRDKGRTESKERVTEEEGGREGGRKR